jgi:uncharacterized protein YndB with AHSA1/START domain
MRRGILFLALLAAVAAVAANAAGTDEEDRAVVKEIVVPAPRADVWKAWTTVEGVTSFFAPAAKIELRPGGAYEMYFAPAAEPGSRGSDGCKVLEIVPLQRFVFSWNAPPQLPAVRSTGDSTRVVLEFSEAEPGRTRVRLTHTGWREGEEWEKARAYFDRVWPLVLAELEKRFTAGPRQWPTP